MKHEMILLDADFQTVLLRLARKFNASLVEQEQRHIRNVQDAVRGCGEAPQEQEIEVI